MAFLLIATGAILAFSLYRIVILPLPFKVRCLLSILRTCLLLLIAIAFIEPTLVLDRLSSPRRPVPVLIDVSKSMNPFAGDSAIVRARTLFEQWNDNHPDKKQQFFFYSFGDSLRRLAEKTPLLPQDRRSYLPEPAQDKTLRQASTVVLISDGNWSNATLPIEAYSDKNVFYLPLPNARRIPFMQLALDHFPKSLPIDSPLVAVINLDGFSDHSDTILAGIVEKNNRIAMRTIPVPSGFFRQTISFTLKNRAPGRHLYRFDARSTSNNIQCSTYGFHTVLPNRFGYAVYNASPSLDKRFILLSLKRHREFIESPDATNRHLDCAIFFDWDENAQKMFDRLGPKGTALFIGCLPCTGRFFSPDQAASRIIRTNSQTSATSFGGIDFSSLPPPSRYILCKESEPRAHDTILSAILAHDGGKSADTLPVIFTGRYNRNNFLACAAAGVWRWDFWPLAVEPAEEQAFTFSDRLVSLTKDFIIGGLSDDLFFYPAARLSESDSLSFQIAFPADVPVASEIPVACTFFTTDGRRFDTAFTTTATGSLHQIVHFKPLPAGHCRFEATAAINNRRYTFNDSIVIDHDRSEDMVNGQNRALLQEFAQPLSDFNMQSLGTLFVSNNAESKQPTKEILTFNRKWPLMLLIFLTFAAEWMVRRTIKLD